MPAEEPTEDDREPTDNEEEEVLAAVEEEEKEEEALVEEVDNITDTIPPEFAPMPHYKKRGLKPPSPNTIVEDEDDSSLE